MTALSQLKLLPVWVMLALVSLACGLQIGPRADDAAATTAPSAGPTTRPTSTRPPDLTAVPASLDGDEPLVINGEIPYTSPFFLASTAQPFVMLEDQAGFAARNRDFLFSLPSQVIAPVEMVEEGRLAFSLPLPAVPQATYLDVDNNDRSDTGVQVFAVAYWSNTWGDAFLQTRDGRGWSSAYASTLTDPDNHNEITGGTLVIWAPNDQQAFPTGFGSDNLLFTEDDPVAPVPAGYSLVDLDARPFRVYKEPEPFLTLTEGAGAVNDFSAMSYGEAFDALIEKVAREYPFTAEKNIDWAALQSTYGPQMDTARDDAEFSRLLHDFILQIPDSHVGMPLDQQYFAQNYGGGLGLVAAELSDGKVIASQVLPNLAANQAGIRPGDEIVRWDGKPVGEAIAAVVPGFAPYSSAHGLRLAQVQFLTRTPPGTQVEIEFQPEGGSAKVAQLTAEPEYDSLFASLPSGNANPVALPIEAQLLPSGHAYIKISTFQDDYNLMARVWERYLENLIDAEIPGVILDLRQNGGGSLGLALDFAGFFFDEQIDLYQSYYYNNESGKFEAVERPTRVEPAPQNFPGQVAVLVSANCVSACEGFAFAMQQQERAVIVGHTPSAGAFGEVSRGQYKMPGEITMQFPTGRPMTLDGSAVVIEGTGVVPDIVVPVTAESALGQIDAVLEAAVAALK